MVIDTLLHGNEVPGYPSLIVIILILGGIQLVAIGILAVGMATFFFIGIYSRRWTKSTAEFYVAGGQIPWKLNGVAMFSNYASGASFLGVAGAIALFGIDNIATSGIRIITTVDQQIQQDTLYALRKQLAEGGYEDREVVVAVDAHPVQRPGHRVALLQPDGARRHHVLDSGLLRIPTSRVRCATA